MSADPTSIDRIRNATFASARRGYKKQDVDSFLASLSDWLESGEGREQSVVVKEALQDVGRRTGKILATAEESAQEIREQAQKAREEADTYSKRTRENADQQASALKESSEAEAERTRAVAARDAEEMTSKAKGEVRAIVADGESKKAELEAELAELAERRDAILRRIDELASQLTGTADHHRSGAHKNVAGNGDADTAADDGEESAAKPARAAAKKTKAPARS